jgi:hypothetical protein
LGNRLRLENAESGDWELKGHWVEKWNHRSCKPPNINAAEFNYSIQYMTFNPDFQFWELFHEDWLLFVILLQLNLLLKPPSSAAGTPPRA